MGDIYDKIILQNLLDIDDKVVTMSKKENIGEKDGDDDEEDIERGACFVEAKLGGSTWKLP